jgi:hypothetical protein
MTCDHEFEEPARERELLGEYYHDVDACPYCHSDDIHYHVYKDVYGDYIYPGYEYYEFGEDIVAEDNLNDYISDSRHEA